MFWVLILEGPGQCTNEFAMSFIQELQRSNVFNVAIAYAVAACLLIQIVATTSPILNLPDWSVWLHLIFKAV